MLRVFDMCSVSVPKPKSTKQVAEWAMELTCLMMHVSWRREINDIA